MQATFLCGIQRILERVIKVIHKFWELFERAIIAVLALNEKNVYAEIKFAPSKYVAKM